MSARAGPSPHWTDLVALSRFLQSSPVDSHCFIDRSLHADGAEVVRVAPFRPRIVADPDTEILRHLEIGRSRRDNSQARDISVRINEFGWCYLFYCILSCLMRRQLADPHPQLFPDVSLGS